MDNIYSMGTAQWRKWIYYWINKNSSDNSELQTKVSELEDLVNALIPENALITSNGSYVISTDGKYLITV